MIFRMDVHMHAWMCVCMCHTFIHDSNFACMDVCMHACMYHAFIHDLKHGRPHELLCLYILSAHL